MLLKHNQHQIDEPKQMQQKKLCFLNFKDAYTPRFCAQRRRDEKLEFKACDKQYKLEPSTLDKNPIDNKNCQNILVKKKIEIKNQSHIECTIKY